MTEAVKAYRQLNPAITLLGAVHSIWEETLRTEIFNCKPRGMCGMDTSSWPRSTVEEDGGRGRAFGLAASGPAGPSWVVDQGKDLDVDHVSSVPVLQADCILTFGQFQATSDIKRSYDYYESRLPHSTVIRPALADRPCETAIEAGPAAAILLTHSDGSLGALHTRRQTIGVKALLGGSSWSTWPWPSHPPSAFQRRLRPPRF